MRVMSPSQWVSKCTAQMIHRTMTMYMYQKQVYIIIVTGSTYFYTYFSLEILFGQTHFLPLGGGCVEMQKLWSAELV